jgi:ketosteroid isomerase-like protein
MNRHVTLLLAGTTLVVAACAPAAGGKGTDSATVARDMASVGKVRDAYAAAFKAGDAAAITALYTDDGLSQNNFMPTANGPAGITAANKAFFDQYTIQSMALTPVKTEVSGTLAYDIGTYAFVGIPKAKGDTLKAEGRYVVLLRKLNDSTWKAIADMDNVTAMPGPPPPPKKK